MKPFSIYRIVLLVLFSTQLSIAQNFQNKLYYKVDHSILTKSHQKKLDNWLDTISLDKLISLEIVGHTDTSASIAYNTQLSRKRAEYVRTYFSKKGVNKSLIKFSFYGESQAKSVSNLQEDRRVDIILKFPSPSPLPTKCKELASTTSIKDFYKLVAPKPQEFCISPYRDTIIRCQYGTLITVKAHSFKLTPQQAATNCINFQVKEAFLKSEMFLENINTTTTDGRLLETQGMVYTNAMIDADTLQLIQDITIMVPTDEVVEEVKIFDGERDLHTDAVNWTINNNSVLRNFSIEEVQNCVNMNHIHKICDCQDSLIGMVQIDKIDCCYNKLEGLLNNGLKDSTANMDCKCPLFFCGFNKLFLWTATRFDQQMRMLEQDVSLCRKRLGAVTLLKKLRNRTRTNSASGKPFRIGYVVYIARKRKRVKKIRRLLIRKKARRGKVELSKEEKKVLELTQLILDSDQKIQRGLNGMVETKFVAQCNELDSLFKAYNVDNTAALVHALNQPLMEELGVNTMQELLDTLPKVNLAYLEVAYRNKKISYEDYKFYIFNSSALGWKNLDVFAKIPQEDQLLVKVNAVPDSTIDCKLVFQKEEFVIPAKLNSKYFYFEGMPRNKKAWLVGIQYKNAIPLFSMESIKIEEKTYDLNLKELTIEELKEQIKRLDFTD